MARLAFYRVELWSDYNSRNGIMYELSIEDPNELLIELTTEGAIEVPTELPIGPIWFKMLPLQQPPFL